MTMSTAPLLATAAAPAAVGAAMSMPTPFDDRWIVVSGASSGIGRAISVHLVSLGARVVLLGRNVDRLVETAQLAGPADRTLVCPLDLAELSAIAPALRALVARTGRLYGLCHSAGVSMTLPLAASKPERARAVMDLNFHAGLELARALVERSVLAEHGGSVLWVSSVYSHVGAPGQIAYCASKGAIASAVRAMALELAPRRVRVNCVSPGLVKTAMTDGHSRMTTEQWARIEALHPLGTGSVNDVARAASFLLDPLNTWITGTDLILDGGYSLQ
jgi:NAD(P)-dependent dehydrogenase (short-subunit alcohol dehydrogenase family)